MQECKSMDILLYVPRITEESGSQKWVPDYFGKVADPVRSFLKTQEPKHLLDINGDGTSLTVQGQVIGTITACTTTSSGGMGARLTGRFDPFQSQWRSYYSCRPFECMASDAIWLALCHGLGDLIYSKTSESYREMSS